MLVHRTNKRHIGAVRKMRMALDLLPHRSPVEVEIVTDHRALRIAHIHQRDFALAGSERQGEALGLKTGVPISISNQYS